MAGMSRTADTIQLDIRELAWAAREIAALLRQTEPGSVVSVVLGQAFRELTSLRESAEGAGFETLRTRGAA